MEDKAEIVIPPGPRLGDLVIRAEGLTKSYGDRLLFEQMDLIPTRQPKLLQSRHWAT